MVRYLRRFALLLALLGGSLGGAQAVPHQPDPLKFVDFLPNHGQADASLAYYAPVANGIIAVRRDGHLEYRFSGATRNTVVQERFEGAQRPSIRPEGGGPVIRLYPGDLSLTSHSSLRLEQVWPGIDVSLARRGETVEKIFHLVPGADPGAIRLRIEGAQKLTLEDDGRLRLDTTAGPMYFTAPVAYQPGVDGQKTPVTVAYRLDGGHYGFTLGDYDPKRPVVIDPLLGGAFLRNSGILFNYVGEVETMRTGEVIVVGGINNPLWLDLDEVKNDSPSSADEFRSIGYIAKFNRELTQLITLALLLGDRPDSISLPLSQTILNAVEIVPNNDEVIVAGTSNAPGLFPNPWQPYYDAQDDAIDGNKREADFILARFNKDLELLSGTYLGGADEVDGWTALHDSIGGIGVFSHVSLALAQDAQGYSIYLAGNSRSGDLQGIIKGGPNPPDPYAKFNPRGRGKSSCFIARFKSDLSDIMSSTWLGGTLTINNSQWEAVCTGITVDNLGTDLPTIYGDGFSVYVSGAASGDLPADGWRTQQPDYDPNADNNPWDGFVARLSADLYELRNATYLVGTASRQGGPVTFSHIDALHLAASEIVVGGYLTENTSFLNISYSDFPFTTPDPNHRGAFLARLQPDLSDAIQVVPIKHCEKTTFAAQDCNVSSSHIIAMDVPEFATETAVRYDVYLYLADNGLGTANTHFHYPSSQNSSAQPVAEGMLARYNQQLQRLAAMPEYGANTRLSSPAAIKVSQSYESPDGSQTIQDPRLFLAVAMSNSKSGGWAIHHPQELEIPPYDNHYGSTIIRSGMSVRAFDLAFSKGTAKTRLTQDEIDLGYIFTYTELDQDAWVEVVNNNPFFVEILGVILETADPTVQQTVSDVNFTFLKNTDRATCSPASPFPVTNNHAQVVIPGSGGSCRINYNFQLDTPSTTPKNVAVKVSLVTNDPANALIEGTTIRFRNSPVYASAQSLNRKITRTGLDMGTVAVGQREHELVFLLSKTGNIQLGEVQLSDDTHFSIVNNQCSQASISPGSLSSGCLLSLRFSPQSAGAHETHLTVATADGQDEYLRIRIHGTGEASGGAGGSAGGGSGGSGGGLFGALGLIEASALLLLALAMLARRRPARAPRPVA